MAMSMDEDELKRHQMKPLVSDLDYYAEAYRAYAGFTGHKLRLYQKWTDDVFVPSAVVELDQQLRESIQGADFRILGIGSGGGEIDVCLLERLSSRFHSISNTVIEPSSEAITKYTALLHEKEVSLQGVKTHFKQTTIQDFCRERKTVETADSRPKFHFIHAIQSLYYASDLKGAMADMFEMLEEGGAMLIIMMTDEHVIYRMWDSFSYLTGQQTSSTNKLSSEDITEALKQLGLSCNNIHTVHCRTEASSCFDPKSDVGNKVLDFLTNTIQFRDNAPSGICDKVLAFLRAICSSHPEDEPSDSEHAEDASSEMVFGQEDEARGKLLFNRDWKSFIVFKPIIG